MTTDYYIKNVSGGLGSGTYTVGNTTSSDKGNDPPSRLVSVTTTVAPTSAAIVYAATWLTGAGHNPSTQCPMANVTFCVESKRGSESDSGLSDGVVFFIRQNGNVYATLPKSIGVNWKRADGTFVVTDFTDIGSGSHPDFSATGSLMEFGFGLRLPVQSGSTPYSEVYFDNLCISRVFDCGNGTPCPSASCDSYNTGTLLSVISQASGTTYSIDGSSGLPAGSHKFEFPANSSLKAVSVVVDSDVFQYSNSCHRPAAVSICVNYKTSNPDGGTDGDSIAFFLVQGGTVVAIGQVFIPGDTGNNWSLHTAFYSIPTTTTLDLSSPVSLTMTVSGGNRTHRGVVNIDNICHKALFHECVCESTLLDFTNLSTTAITPDGTGVYQKISDFVNQVLSSTLIPSVIDNCIHAYRISSPIFQSTPPTLYTGEVAVTVAVKTDDAGKTQVVVLTQERLGAVFTETTIYFGCQTLSSCSVVDCCSGATLNYFSAIRTSGARSDTGFLCSGSFGAFPSALCWNKNASSVTISR